MLTLATAEGAAAAATGVTAYAWLLIVFPAFGALLLLVGGKRTDRFGPILAVCLSWASFSSASSSSSRWSAATPPTIATMMTKPRRKDAQRGRQQRSGPNRFSRWRAYYLDLKGHAFRVVVLEPGIPQRRHSRKPRPLL